MAEASQQGGEPPADTPGASPSVPIPDHKLLTLIGRGSYGEVWLAQTAVGTYRAVKIVYEQTFRHRRPFEREFKGVQKFEPLSRLHEGLVDILQIGRNEERGYFYCVMEVADDLKTGKVIDPDNYTPHTLCAARETRLPLNECRRIGATIASALDFLHGRGLIHRDVKPSNIIFVDGVPKLADIGLVAEMSEARSYVGTEGFIPPEGPGTVQADIYSLGKVLYEISTGKDRHDYPELPPPLKDPIQETEFMDLNKVILKACRAESSRRYRCAREMAADLGQVPDRNSVRRQKSAGIGIAIIVCLLIVGVVLTTRQSRKPSTPEAGAERMTLSDLLGWWEGDSRDRCARLIEQTPFGISYEPGLVGRAFNFDGTRRRITIPDRSMLEMTNGFTLGAWIYPRQYGGIICMRGDDRPGLDPWELVLQEGVVEFHICGDDFRTTSVSAPVNVHQWQYVAATWDRLSKTFTVYVNGLPAASTHSDIIPLRDLDRRYNPSMGIGNCGGIFQNNPFNGLIDEVTIYSRALSPAEIRNNFNWINAKRNPASLHPALVVPAGVVAWWKAEGVIRNEVVVTNTILSTPLDANGPYGSYGVGFTSGKVGRAFDFIPSGHRIRAHLPDRFPLTNSLTIEAWIFPRSEAGILLQHGTDTPGAKPMTLRLEAPSKLVFEINSPTGSVNISAPIQMKQWTHVAATADSLTGEMNIYVDGMLAAKTNSDLWAAAVSNKDPVSDLTLGNGCETERDASFDGCMDELTLYSRALSGGEIQAIYKAGALGKVPLSWKRPANPSWPHPPGIPAPPGLIGWWPGEKTAEDVLNRNNGEPVWNVVYSPGLVGNCFFFPYGNGYIKIPGSTTLDPGEQVTVEFWMKAYRANAMDSIQGLVTSDFYSIEISSGAGTNVGINFVISTDNGASYARTSDVNHGGAIITTGVWHYIAGTYDGAKAQLYIDGKPWGKPVFHSGKISPMLPNSFLAIGSSDGRSVCSSCKSTQYFTGRIDETSIYNRALAPQEIAAIYNAQAGGKIVPASARANR